MTNFKWGRRSLKKRAELDPRLQQVFDQTLKLSPFDLAITDGHRGKAAQDKAFEEGASKLKYPNSKHNSKPSQAGHIDPYPINYDDWKKYYVLAGIVFVAAKQVGVKVRWGGDWDSDFTFNDQSFNDLAHWELV